jgi:hypothetical protein
MFKTQSSMLALVANLAAVPASANIIIDWDAYSVAILQGNAPTPPPRVGGVPGAIRAAAIMHIAMFEAVNAIEPRYRPFSGEPKPQVDASQDAAAASAAATVLMKLDPDSVPKIEDVLDKSLAAIPDGDARTKGIRLGAESAAGILGLRANDGYGAPNAFRPITQPRVYIERQW